MCVKYTHAVFGYTTSICLMWYKVTNMVDQVYVYNNETVWLIKW